QHFGRLELRWPLGSRVVATADGYGNRQQKHKYKCGTHRTALCQNDTDWSVLLSPESDPLSRTESATTLGGRGWRLRNPPRWTTRGRGAGGISCRGVPPGTCGSRGARA